MQISGVELEDLEFHSIGSWPRGLRIILIFFVGVLVVVMGYLFILSDVYDEYRRIRIQREALMISFEQSYDQASNLEAYKKQLIVVEQTLNELSRQLPKTAEEAELLEDISRLAASSGLTFQSFKPLPEIKKGFYVEHPIELSMQGSYHGFGDFIGHIAAMPRIVTFHDFIIKSAPDNPKRLDITITVQTYWATRRVIDIIKQEQSS